MKTSKKVDNVMAFISVLIILSLFVIIKKYGGI